MSEKTQEQWWTHHAALLAEKMKASGVKSFHIEETPRGTFKFEVTPIAKRDESNRRWYYE